MTQGREGRGWGLGRQTPPEAAPSLEEGEETQMKTDVRSRQRYRGRKERGLMNKLGVGQKRFLIFPSDATGKPSILAEAHLVAQLVQNPALKDAADTKKRRRFDPWGEEDL